MPDGVTLAADLHLPESAVNALGRYPAIIEYTPYHKNNNLAYGPRASRYPYFAAQGYVFVNVDIRGTGDSGGCNTTPSSPEEIRDNLEVIRWCARQPWCDGNVGMIGISYTAGVCYDAARLAPPELKAVVLCQMTSDWYQGMACPGGSPRPFAYENYAPLMAAYHFAPPHPDLVGAEWTQLWEQRLQGSRPWALSYLEHLEDGPFWESRLLRNDIEKVRAATFLIGGWCDYYPDDFLRVYSRLQCPKRVLIGPWTHNYPENAWPLPRLNDRYECLRWFDKYLKGRDTDPARPVDQEPPVTLFVREFTPPEALRREDAGEFCGEHSWPPAQTQERIWQLTTAGELRSAAEEIPPGSCLLTYRPDVGIAAGRYAIGQMLPGWGMPDDQRLDEGLSLVYTLAPREEPLELAGVARARLWLECTAPVAFVSVKLCDVAPDGTSVLVTKGLLNLAHRHSSATPEPLVPGQLYEMEIPFQAMAYRFRAGHRVRLMLAAADFLNQWPTPLPHQLRVHCGFGRSSQIVLPCRAPGATPGPMPEFLSSEFEPLPASQIPTPKYVIRRDMIQQQTTVEIRTQSGIGINESAYTVNHRQPAEAAIQSEYAYRLERPGMAIVVHAHCVTRSDLLAFHQLTEVEITVNGRPHWNRSWSLSVPRRWC